MAINSHEVEAVVHNRYFFMDFDFVCGDEREYKRNKYSIPQLMANTMVQILSLCITPFISYVHFNLFSCTYCTNQSFCYYYFVGL